MADFNTVARPYARALFGIAQAAGNLRDWSQALAAAANVVDDAGVRRYLAKPDLRPGEGARLIENVCEDVDGAALLASAEGRALLRLLDDNERLAALPAIAERFEQLKSEAEHRIEVTLVSAVQVEPDVAQRVTEALEKKLGRRVQLALEVDPALLGGAVIKAEDMVIDGSVRSRLQRLAESLID